MHLKHQVSFAKQKLLVTMCGWLACLLSGDPVAVAQQYPGIKCIIDGNQQCRTEHTVEFNWDKESKGKKCFGKIFFSSQDAADQFQTHVISKLELGQQPDYLLLLRANHQLALTGQVKQQLCPITEKSIDSEHQLLIAGVKIHFHDAAAKNKVESQEATWQRAKQVFAPPVFARSFSKRGEPAKQAGVAVADESANNIVSEAESTRLPTKR